MRGLERLLKQNSGGGKARSRVGNAPIRTRLFYGGRLRTAYSRTNLGTINPQGCTGVHLGRCFLPRKERTRVRGAPLTVQRLSGEL